ncbi:MAG: GNAT family N-acetyltransferase, partial [Bdellovibrionota bacterium]
LADCTSLAGRTDLSILAAGGSRIRSRSEYLVIDTPGNPGYFWGNYLYFRKAPTATDVDRWQSLFRREFAAEPRVRHFTFGWDEQTPGTEFPEFLRDATSVLALEAAKLVKPPRAFETLLVRPLESDADWEAMVQNQISCRLEGFKLESYEPFKRRQAATFRAMSEAGRGHWWGGFVAGRLVAECGLFLFGNLGRFQAVGTHPEFRRRGICAALVHEISLRTLAANPERTLVMCAAADEPAERVYRSVGFEPRQRQWALCRYPSDEWM